MVRSANDRQYDWSAINKLLTDFEALSPPIILISVLIIASNGPINTIISLIALPLFLYRIRQRFSKRNQLKQTKFFLSWSLSSLVILILVFELQVVPLLEILFIENLVLVLLTFLALILVIILRKRGIEANVDHCLYSHWIRSAIPQTLHPIYVVSQVLAAIALLYGSQLTLTTICHSRIVFESVLIPDDCSEVYSDKDVKISFVSAIYALQMAVCLLVCSVSRALVSRRTGGQSSVKYVRLNQLN